MEGSLALRAGSRASAAAAHGPRPLRGAPGAFRKLDIWELPNIRGLSYRAPLKGFGVDIRQF